MRAMQRKYSTAEAAKLLGVSRQTLWRRLRDGEIPSTVNPLNKRQRLIDEAVIDSLLEQAGRPRQTQAEAA